MTLKPTWDDVIAWWKEEKVKREAATARATAAEALAGDALRALTKQHEWGHGGSRAFAERCVNERCQDITSVLMNPLARRILERGAGLEAGGH